MADRVFVDTNVLVYAEDAAAGAKRTRAREVIQDLIASGRLVLSTQSGMHAAHRIYRRLGFVRTPERDWEPVPGLGLLTYALEL